MVKKGLKKLLATTTIAFLLIANGNANIVRANEEVENVTEVKEVLEEATTEEVTVEEETVPMINTALPLEAALKEAGLSVEENSEVQEETKETLEVVEEEPVNETSKEEPVEENNEEPEEVVVEEEVEETTLQAEPENTTNTSNTTITINVTKVWNGGSGSHDSVTVKLLNAANNQELKEIEITSAQKDENGNWYGSFTDLPKYDENGEIQYKVEEVLPEGYTTDGPTDWKVVGNTSNTTITNIKEDKPEPEYGGIEIQKQLYISGSFYRKYTGDVVFTYEVYNASDQSITLKDGTVVEANGLVGTFKTENGVMSTGEILPPGNYKAVEVDIPDEFEAYRGTGAGAEKNEVREITVTANEVYKAEHTNIRNTGQLEIEKRIQTSSGSNITSDFPNEEFEIQVKIKDPDGNPLEGSYYYGYLPYDKRNDMETYVSLWHDADNPDFEKVTFTEGVGTLTINTKRFNYIFDLPNGSVIEEVKEILPEDSLFEFKEVNYSENGVEQICKIMGQTSNYGSTWVRVVNTIDVYGGFKVIKRDGEFYPVLLQGAKVNFINVSDDIVVLKDGTEVEDGEIIETLVTDENGEINTEIKYPKYTKNGKQAKYKIEEIEAPEGYYFLGDSRIIDSAATIREPNQVIERNPGNSKKSGVLYIYKEAENTPDTFEFEITLTDENGNGINDWFYYYVTNGADDTNPPYKDNENAPYSKVTFVDGKATISLSLSEEYKRTGDYDKYYYKYLYIYDIPFGTTASVKEKPKNGWYLLEEDFDDNTTFSETKSRINYYFTNSNNSPIGQFVLEGQKILEGETLSEGQFTFELLDADGNVLQTVTNDADGNIIFDPIKVDVSKLTPRFVAFGENYQDLPIATEEERERIKYWKELGNNFGYLYQFGVPDNAYSDDVWNFDGIPYSEANDFIKEESHYWFVNEKSDTIRYFDDISLYNYRYYAVLFEGELNYQIREVVPTDTGAYTYDAHVEDVTVSVKGAELADAIIDVQYDSDGVIFTNTLETTEFEVTKVWEDNDNEDGIRPESITVELLADGEEKESVEVTEADGWKYTFKDLPKYNNGQEIIYTIKEFVVEGYNSTVSGDMASGYTVTNTHELEKIQLSVTKVWDDENDKDKMRPASVTVKLLANGKDTGKTVTLNKDNSWKASFADLYKYENGKEISYDVEEVVPNGYTVAKSGDMNKGYTLTNTHKPSTKTPTKTTSTWTPVPFTGDNFNVWVWIGLLCGAILVVGGTTYFLKKN